jgi:hypothetical protein
MPVQSVQLNKTKNMLTVHIWQLYFDLALSKVKAFITEKKSVLRAARFIDVKRSFIHSNSNNDDDDEDKKVSHEKEIHCIIYWLDF